MTTDIDVKVLVTREACQDLLDCLGQDYKPLLDGDPHTMLASTGMLFVQDSENNRVDLLLSVIYKLISTRARDHEDANNVIRRQGKALDLTMFVVGLGSSRQPWTTPRSFRPSSAC